MYKSKKKIKTTTKLPKPIKIKKEKTEEDRTLHSMSHYIDDRLELVKQIFGTLKPKTIVNLAPDFLKKKSMEEIEELCLNELLCISTKRLTSIINATKCPTDTESSSDSDVERHEEHISLEEISSDSEIEGTSNADDGQISVLELLELQARARAIRSQLALEPVTKIEVDSDDQGGGRKEKKHNPEETADITEKESRKEKKRDRNERKRKSGEAEPEIRKSETSSTIVTSTKKVSKPSESTSEPITSSGSAGKEPHNRAEAKRTSKKIKLKRNYRKPSPEQKESEMATASTTKNAAPSISKDVKLERKSRSPSPDVIPIVAEPETLLISDSSDEETRTKKTTTQDTVAEQKSSTEGATVKVTETRKPSETEEGEITENEADTSRSAEPNCTAEEITEKAEANINKPAAATEELEVESSVETPADEERTNVNLQEEENTKILPENIDEESRQSIASERSRTTSTNLQNDDSNTVTNAEDDDDQNDDVISIEGGDLESEMIEHLEEESKSSLTTTSKKDETSPQAQGKDADVISLDSSDDEECSKDNAESWHSRYLKSSKVNKVLLTSRLGKRVRDKIKKSKRTKTIAEHEPTKEEASKSNNTYTSKHEDGSMEQYKELLEMRQRKN